MKLVLLKFLRDHNHQFFNSNTDIKTDTFSLLQLGKNANRYSVDQSVTPHKIIEWDSGNKDSQPTDDELNLATD